MGEPGFPEETSLLGKILLVVNRPILAIRQQLGLIDKLVIPRIGREPVTAVGNCRWAGSADSCAAMLAVAESPMKVASFTSHGPNGISFSSATSGRSHSIRRARSCHAGCSGERPSGSSQTLIFTVSGLAIWRISGASPNAHTLLRFEIQPLPGTHVKGVVPRIDVSNG